ncbi:chromosome segregation protein SMC [Geobacter metallireducens RCH3]|uniref:Chromosome partition protein Smc n=1 Tax=Geobacter metallireducens (strain ATCC 53774 / DSM 7210 / GS-15) TaxID=269799 RepID=Q39WG2_GEOMG|nr:chromosome segregation protein SMC [Geobacter metallireducens]ABB31412.1 chromosome segregation ATPase SMC [Geobacter metallireducens GS-15]EHP86222.1 chromosome segregation protein SMC [Geobacter metallireducens RCH3]
MKIKRLDISGFKSFVDKVSLDFQQGITSIVGPNGCGKSNVVDAIRWVMGEQSAKNLRGKSMEDIIFGGSESRKPLGMAEVSMAFSTEDGRVPAKYLNYSEIQVTRRLYRDGESDYFLNKTPCRLMDITELFMDTGVGARAYSIIEQGKIGMILHSKPEERRFLIEEAAGVTKFKAKKQVALKKIDLTRQNLLRIGDILAEIRRQLNSLQRQVKKAERFREYREELREIEVAATVRRFIALDAAKEQVEEALRQSVSRASTLTADLEQRELGLDERRLALVERERSLASAQEVVFSLKGEIQGHESRIEFQRKELGGLERQEERLVGELEGLEGQLAAAGEELARLVEQSGTYAVEAAGEEDTLATREKELEEMAAAERELSTDLEEVRRELFSLLAEVAQLNNQRTAATRRLEGLAERVERNRREGLLLNERLVESSGRATELEKAVAGLGDQKTELQERLPLLTRRETELRERLADLDREIASRRDELSRKSSRLHSLQELEAQFAGYGQGVRNLLLADTFRGRFAGVIADFVETEPEFETALEAVLAERLQYVVCPQESDAFEALAYLSESGGGRCSLVAGIPSMPGSDAAPDGAVPILSHVTIAEGRNPVVEHILAGTYLVGDLATACSLSRLHPHSTFVTLRGDVAFGGGIVSGGSTEAAGPGLVHKKREIRELTGEVERLTAVLDDLDATRGRTQQERAGTEEEVREVRQSLHQTDIQLVNAEKDLIRAKEEVQRVEERLAVTGMEDDQLREERETLEGEIVDADTRKAVREEKKGTLEAELERLQETLTVRKREIDAAREAVTTLKVRGAQLREKKEAASRALKRTEELLSDLQARITRHREERERCAQERERLVASLAGGDGELKSLLARHAEAEGASATFKREFDGQAEAVRVEEGALRELRVLAEQAKNAVATDRLRQSELTLELNHLVTSLMEKYRLEMLPLLPKYADTPFDEETASQRQEELSRLIDEMGEVNLTAIEEYRELDERFTFLSGQKADLEESLHSLQQAIQRINRTTRKRFLETFNLVNEKFQEVFPRLFCGGRAELKLTNEEDLLETGIDIIVQPPGKKLQNVTLLSGGEKALTAVALIFSIFLIKPSPFCLLDEVDAPLDDANIGRFNDMVREMSEISQFIIITHNKATMAVADTLYGVTMEEPGVSKIVSVKLN